MVGVQLAALVPKQRHGVAAIIDSWKGTLLHVRIANLILDSYLGISSPDPMIETLGADSTARERDRLERAESKAPSHHVR